MSNRPKVTGDRHRTVIDANRAVMLTPGVSAQTRARSLIRENAELFKLLGVLLERTGPVEVDGALLADQSVLYEVEKYDSTDGVSVRWVAKRVAG